jgi:uncharacterized protein Yka (UPF0111/DUF47 family)
MAEYKYTKIKLPPIHNKDKELQKFTEDVRKAIEELHKVIKKLTDKKEDA